MPRLTLNPKAGKPFEMRDEEGAVLWRLEPGGVSPELDVETFDRLVYRKTATLGGGRVRLFYQATDDDGEHVEDAPDIEHDDGRVGLTELQTMSRKDLVAMCEAEGLATTGTKADMVGRIVRKYTSKSDPVEALDPEVDADATVED